MSYLLWIILWFFVILFAFIPELSTPLARLFGIERGLDFLVIVSIIFMFYLIFRLYIKIDTFQQNITLLVRELALENEIKYDEEEEEE